MRILNTRPSHQAGPLSHDIRVAGGISIELPALQIEALALDWLDNLPDLSAIQKAIFVSTNAVDYFFKGLRFRHFILPNSIQIFAIGHGTATQLKKYHILNCKIPPIADSEHLLALKELQEIKNHKVLLISGEKGRPLIASTLKERGAFLYQINTYRRCMPQKNFPFTRALWQDDAVDIILVLSQEAMMNLFDLFETAAKDWILSKPFVVISQRLVACAHRYGIKTVIFSHYDDLLMTLTRLSHGTGRNAF
ncbi:MAG TPA: uroporphyrinogen-III synthase [Legionellaceae bacterium]|nr:uroporphyrinogen-III synthase [Legionellaceae bacterium]